MLELAQIITHFENESIEIANGVALSKDFLFVISGKNNCVYKFHKVTLEEIDRCGSWGYAKRQFKTPVAIACHNDMLYLADWFNHRVVCLDSDLRFIRSFGYFRDANTTSHGRRGLEYVRRLGRMNGERKCPSLVRLSLRGALLVKELCQSIIEVGAATFLKRFLGSEEISFNKPDGFAFSEDHLFISQHYNHAITKLNVATGDFKVFGTFGAKHGQFDRPSNILFNVMTQELFVSDVFNGRIEVFDPHFCYKRTICGNSSELLGHFMPFGLAFVSKNVLAVCGAESIQLFEITSGKLIHDYRGDHDQFHGLAYDSERGLLFAADRLKHRVCIFQLDLNTLSLSD